MKKGTLLCLLLLLCLTALPAFAEKVQVETPVFSNQREIIGTLNTNDDYQTVQPPEEEAFTDQEWLNVYTLAYVAFHDVDQDRDVQGWIVTGYLPQPLGIKPQLHHGGRLLEVKGAENTLYFEGLDKRQLDTSGFGVPIADDMPMEEALEIALRAIEENYGETDATLARFQLVEYGFQLESGYLSLPYWQFDFSNDLNHMDSYEIMIHSPDGAVMLIQGMGEGNG